jgi:hypothetical protein
VLLTEKAIAVKPIFGLIITLKLIFGFVVNINIKGVAGVKSIISLRLAGLPSFFFLKYSIVDV